MNENQNINEAVNSAAEPVMRQVDTQNPAISIKKINKTIGKRHILHDISFDAYGSEVFGFLGPNGAGKTTTIKMIVGLLSTDDGEISICGSDINKDFEKALSYVGGIVENPEMYKQLTGYQNLQQYARMRDGVTEERIKEVVELVGLSNRINEKITKYSLGMRQRLGVAQAILHRPKVLILDEPTNGLDPAGIKELRDILKKLAHEEGVCVIVSSHLMSEMELMCDRVGVIANGQMIGVYSIEELLKSSAGDTTDFVIDTDDNACVCAMLSQYDAKLSEEGRIEIILPSDTAMETIASINALIVANGTKLYTVSEKPKKKLEDVFIEMTQQEGDGQIA